MSDTPDDQLAALTAKLAASKAMGGGYSARVTAIEAEIKRLEAERGEES